MTTRTRTQRLTNITGQRFILFQVTFEVFPAEDWANVFYAASTWHQGTNQPRQHFSEDGPWSVPLWPGSNCPSPTDPQQMLQWVARHKRAISNPLAQGLAAQRFHWPWRKQEKGTGMERCHSHPCFSPLLKKPQGILQDPGALAQVGVGNEVFEGDFALHGQNLPFFFLLSPLSFQLILQETSTTSAQLHKFCTRNAKLEHKTKHPESSNNARAFLKSVPLQSGTRSSIPRYTPARAQLNLGSAKILESLWRIFFSSPHSSWGWFH